MEHARVAAGHHYLVLRERVGGDFRVLSGDEILAAALAEAGDFAAAVEGAEESRIMTPRWHVPFITGSGTRKDR